MDNKERPYLTLYHTNNGTGSALKLKLYPARVGDFDSGAIYATLAPYNMGPRNFPSTHPTFDWDNAAQFKLEFQDLAAFMQVLRGDCESLEEGKGLYKFTKGVWQIVKLRHVTEPVPGYTLDVRIASELNVVSDSDKCGHIFISPRDALGLLYAIQGSMSAVCFGLGRDDDEEV